MHLRNQVVNLIELLLFAQPADEVYMDVPAIDVVVEIEQVDLEDGLGPIERGSRPDACDGIARFVARL